MFEMRFARERGGSDLGWARSRHSFSFADYWNSKQNGFSDLLILNDDTIVPSKGFGMHSHRNMEIISYVLEGALEHKDSMGNSSVITPSDIQLMSAGQGISHSEFNHSTQENVHLLQIWIVPNQAQTVPSFQQISIAPEDMRGKFHLMISPQGGEKALAIKQDIRIYAGRFDSEEFDGEETADFHIPENRYVYIHVAKGRISVNGQIFNAGDAARIRDGGTLSFRDGELADVLIFDMRPQETPRML